MERHSLTKSAFAVIGMAVACGFPIPAAAASLVVASWNLPREVKITGTHFEVDEKAAQARVAVDLIDESFETSIHSQSVTVPGLVFDRESREVRYENDGESVTCAVRKKILWATTYSESGACRVTVTSEPRTTDGDSGARDATGWVVELAASDATAVAPRGQ